MSTSPPDRLAEMPLWRLLVLLADVERDVGPASPTARLVARLVAERLRGGKAPPDPPAIPAGRKAVARA